GRRPVPELPRPRLTRRDHPRQGHQPPALLPRAGRQEHLGGDRQLLLPQGDRLRVLVCSAGEVGGDRRTPPSAPPTLPRPAPAPRGGRSDPPPVHAAGLHAQLSHVLHPLAGPGHTRRPHRLPAPTQYPCRLPLCPTAYVSRRPAVRPPGS